MVVDDDDVPSAAIASEMRAPDEHAREHVAAAPVGAEAGARATAVRP